MGGGEGAERVGVKGQIKERAVKRWIGCEKGEEERDLRGKADAKGDILVTAVRVKPFRAEFHAHQTDMAGVHRLN